MNQESDQYYVQEVLDGDANAFSVLVERYQDHTYGLALRITGNAFDAEEVAQDAFLKAYKSLNTFKQKSKFSTWLYRITYNTAITRQRQNKTKDCFIDLADAHQNELVTTMNVFNELYKEERKLYLDKAMEKLSDDEKFLIHLYYTDEKNVKDICEILKITEENVKIKLYRIRKKLLLVLSQSLKNEIFDIYGK
jgi:RNA polymerase sigma-70 factor (ECF subfamily)